jgi:hypothetical protein
MTGARQENEAVMAICYPGDPHRAEAPTVFLSFITFFWDR